MLPEETKQAARDQFDGDMLMIRRELFEPVFGYRKASIADLWKADPMDRTRIQQFVVKALEMTFGKIFGDKLVMRLRQGEAGWQEIVRAVKDILVIKTGFTLIGNVVSNIMLLKLSGVSWVDIVKHKTEAWRGVLRYQKEHTEVFKLQSMLEAQPMSKAEQAKTHARIAELENSLANNPVKELIDAGLFQTIVEDIETGDDPFSYKSKLFKKAEKLTANIPQGMKTAANTLAMSHDTAMYKFLNQSTQVSDFAARYAQFKHYTERGNKPLSKEEAMKRIVANFVNYDVPTGKGLQYLNDMGLVMFTKYYLRIQRPIIRLAQENPTGLLTLLLGQGLFDFAAPTDSSLLNNGLLSRIHNPFDVAIGSIDEIATLNGLMHGTGIK
jgi:predicted transcriptional regulator